MNWSNDIMIMRLAYKSILYYFSLRNKKDETLELQEDVTNAADVTLADLGRYI